MKKPPVLPIDEDLPGLGQFYCIPCSRYFKDNPTLQEHMQSSKHKRKYVREMMSIWDLKRNEASSGSNSLRHAFRQFKSLWHIRGLSVPPVTNLKSAMTRLTLSTHLV